MTTISGSSGASAWASLGSTRAAQMQQRMFASTDSNGDGRVDKSELQTLLDKVADKGGTTSLNADDIFSKLDADGSGRLDAGELDAGMKSLMPAPSSTVDFAQQRGGMNDAGDLFTKIDANGDGSIDASELTSMLTNGPDSSSATGASDASATAAAGTDSQNSALFAKLDTDGDGKLSKSEFDAGKPSGPPPGGGGPPPSSGAASAATDPLDTNKDGVVSDAERAAGDMTPLIQDILKAADTDGSGSVGRGEFDTLKSKVDDAFNTAIQSLQSTGAGSGSGPASGASSGSSSSSSSSSSQDSTNLAALLDRVLKQYSAASTSSLQQGAGSLISASA